MHLPLKNKFEKSLYFKEYSSSIMYPNLLGKRVNIDLWMDYYHQH